MIMKLCIILGSMLVAGIIAAVIGIVLESIRFNKGICPHCGTKVKFFDTDSHGGRGYKCPNCGWIVWISYYLVDKWRKN